MSTTSDNPSGSRVETYPPRAFIINMYNGYYRSFEDGYQTALVELEKLIESEHQQATLKAITKNVTLEADLAWCIGKLAGLGHPAEHLEEKYRYLWERSSR